MEKNDYVIVSPHGDDELIGNYSAIVDKKINPIIIYTSDMDEERKQEILTLPKYVEVKAQLFCKEVFLLVFISGGTFGRFEKFTEF